MEDITATTIVENPAAAAAEAAEAAPGETGGKAKIRIRRSTAVTGEDGVVTCETDDPEVFVRIATDGTTKVLRRKGGDSGSARTLMSRALTSRGASARGVGSPGAAKSPAAIGSPRAAGSPVPMKPLEPEPAEKKEKKKLHVKKTEGVLQPDGRCV